MVRFSLAKIVLLNTVLASSSKVFSSSYLAEKCPMQSRLALQALANVAAWSAVVWQVSAARTASSLRNVAS